MMVIEVPQRLRQARRLGLVRCEDRHWLASLTCNASWGTTSLKTDRGESGECWTRARDCLVLASHGPTTLSSLEPGC